MDREMPRLRPLAIGDLLDATFSLYRQNFALFSGIAAVLAVPQSILGAALGFISGTSSLGAVGATTTASSPDLAGTIGTTVATVLIGLVVAALVTGALAYAISQRYLGLTIGVAQAYRGIGMRTYALLLVTTVLQYLSIGLGLLGLFVGAVFLYVKWLFIPQCVVIERTGILGAFRRSWSLVRTFWWRTFGISILLGLISGTVSGVLVALLAAVAAVSGVKASVLTGGLSPLVGILVQPFQLTALTLLYYDLRIRKEGFDLEHLIVTIDSRHS